MSSCKSVTMILATLLFLCLKCRSLILQKLQLLTDSRRLQEKSKSHLEAQKLSSHLVSARAGRRKRSLHSFISLFFETQHL